LGQAILHIHTTFSDGVATVEQILDEVEHNSEVDLVGFTDHDNVHAYERAMRWVEAHPGCRVRPIWGLELTIWAFKHLLVYCFEPPFRTQPFQKFLPLEAAVREIKAAGGTIIVPHVDTFWIGLGRHRLARVAHELGIDGLELLNPYLASARSIRNIKQKNGKMGILAVGGSDAHHIQDLYKVIVDFPGHTPADLATAFHDHTATPRWGRSGGRVPIANLMRQHTRALLFHPAEQLHAWARRPRFAKRAATPDEPVSPSHR
jgi:predicted metal-dependent phosphoesterase TrpH